ncbi:PREDICTED: tripartite motif-containing protein 7-like [Gekko japonicus]|uniref:Tripartite motif-containing protein 7-like n=1 Tax=Gekko japonicus TaxID=146911 RepID=A0ABM1JXD8_GEKJA|nr:PREDICTED: tripartite motif-containing protein 7-like [Gekko japonicus]
MAAEGAVRELCEEATCSICLEFFRDPVAIAECGHSFCRACLTRSWGEVGTAEPSCPQCRGKAQEGSLRPNPQLASIVEIAKKVSPLEGEGAEARGGETAEAKGGEGEGGVCEKHREPLKFFCREDEAPLCVVCSKSQEHRNHQVSPLGEAEPAGERKVIMAARKERVCQKHKEPLKLFCKDHEAPVCVVCEQSQEHQYHNIVPVEEAFQEYKDQFCTCVEILRKERNKILAYKDSLVKESQDLLKQTKGERQKTLTKFRQLQKFLEEQEELFLVQMEGVENEVARNRDRHLARLSEELSSLESLIREMEEKSQQPAGDLLQDVRRTLQRCEEKETFENPVAFPLALKWRIWDFSDLSHLLEGIKKQLKDTLDSGFQKVNVTLDPDTAHPQLILSEGQKSVRRGVKSQSLPNNPERFRGCDAVLGCEGFTASRHFWEVLVGSEEGWRVGVARKSVRRKEYITFSPEEGIWAVGKWSVMYNNSENDCYPPLTASGELKRIRVCLNHTGGRVAFFDADRAALLHEFFGASFSGETLLPFFWVCSKGHLKISS